MDVPDPVASMALALISSCHCLHVVGASYMVCIAVLVYAMANDDMYCC